MAKSLTYHHAYNAELETTLGYLLPISDVQFVDHLIGKTSRSLSDPREDFQESVEKEEPAEESETADDIIPETAADETPGKDEELTLEEKSK